MRARSGRRSLPWASLGFFLALEAAGGCTSLVGLDGVTFTGSGGSGGSAAGGTGGGSTSGTGATSTADMGGGDPTGGTGGAAGGTGGSAGSGGSTMTTTTIGMNPTVCGDGMVEGTEQCDDGGSSNGDGCSAACKVEPFYQCTSTGPSACKHQEVRCDDGADNDGDGQVDGQDEDCKLPSWTKGCNAGEQTLVLRSANVPVAIPNDSGQGARSAIVVTGSEVVTRAAVVLSVVHPEDKDLSADLDSPSGASIELFAQVGGGGENFADTIIDSQCTTTFAQGAAPFAGCFKPKGSLDLSDGPAAGVWELRIKDDSDPHSGSLEAWALVLCAEP